MGDCLSGTGLGPYRLDEQIGRGGMSTVYRAIDSRTGATVAVKVMAEWAAADSSLRERFARQVCVVEHPNVIPIFEVGELSGRLFVAMELITGTDAQAALERGPLRPSRVSAIFAQLCSALTALHRRGLLHLDVKPANVLLHDDGAGVDHVYLMDYGLLDPGVVCRAETFLGTPNYASPEHLRGTSIGPLSDVYSLTCVLFALLAGRPPFAGRLTEVIGGHLRGVAPSLAALTGLPEEIDAVITAGLHPDPEHRPRDPEELARVALEALVGC